LFTGGYNGGARGRARPRWRLDDISRVVRRYGSAVRIGAVARRTILGSHVDGGLAGAHDVVELGALHGRCGCEGLVGLVAIQGGAVVVPTRARTPAQETLGAGLGGCPVLE